MKARAARPASVVHVVENLERGGLERVVIELVRAQRALGMRCRVVCLFGRGALADELAADGVDVSACGKRRGPDMRALRRLRAQLRHEPGAVLHTHNAVAHYYAVLAAIGLPLRQVVNTRHAMPTTGGSGRREWLYRQAMRLTDVCVAVCEAARRQLQAHGLDSKQSGKVTLSTTFEVPGGTAAHREQIVQELIAVYHPSCNEQQYDQSWESHWIGEYDAPVGTGDREGNVQGRWATERDRHGATDRLVGEPGGECTGDPAAVA